MYNLLEHSQSYSMTSGSLWNYDNKSYVINLDNKKYKGTQWVPLFVDRNTAAYFDSFGTEYIPQEVLYKIKDKPITHNIFRIQDPR